MNNILQKLVVSDKNPDLFFSSVGDETPYFTIMHYSGQPLADFNLFNDYFVLILGLRGTGVANMGDFCFKLSAYNFYIMRPNSLNFFQELSKDFQCYFVLFKKDFLMNVLRHEHLIENLLMAEFEEPEVSRLNKSSFSIIYRLFKRLDEEFHGNQLFRDKILQLLFIELLFEVSRTGSGVAAKSLRFPSRQEHLVIQFKALIDEHFLTKRTVKDYADKLFVTAKHLSEVVKEYTGKSALYLIHHRMFQEAKYWLSQSGLSIKEIADKLNFDTSSHFSRFFKHYAGYNPTEFQHLYLTSV